jgi:hypothetical protein
VFCAGFGSSTVISTFSPYTTTLSNESVVATALSVTLFQAGAATTPGPLASSSLIVSPTVPFLTDIQPPSTSQPASKKVGISSGALAVAIAVPIIVVAFLALGCGIFTYRKRKTAKAPAGEV